MSKVIKEAVEYTADKIKQSEENNKKMKQKMEEERQKQLGEKPLP